MREHWLLDPEVTFLNHGSFGACPKRVQEMQAELREAFEREPVQFFLKRYAPELEKSRARVASFLGAAPEDLAFVANATTGVNTVLKSLRFAPGDEILLTSHTYPACRNAADQVAEVTGARTVVVDIELPAADDGAIVDAVLRAVSPRTRLAVLDHVTSPSALVMPIEALVLELEGRGVDVLVDGAHGPGLVEVDLNRLSAAYYAANFHKWCCAPKGCGVLHVRRDRQSHITPLVTSHGRTQNRGRSKFLEEFDWVGTEDLSARLCLPQALEFVGGLLPGGWPEVRQRNLDLARKAEQLLRQRLSLGAAVRDGTRCAMASLRLPGGGPHATADFGITPLQDALMQRHRIEVPVFVLGAHRWLRISAHLYNQLSDYELLADALAEELALEAG